MSKTRKAIVEFARANVYWYVHQHDQEATEKVNKLERKAKALVDLFGKQEEQVAFHQANWRTMYMEPAS